jgi:hypothetical protein
MRPRPSHALSALLAVGLLAGCGGGGGTRLSLDAFVSEADAVCTAALRKQQQLPTPTSIDGIPGYVDRARPIIDAMVGDLRNLRPPRDMEASVKTWLDLTVQARDELASLRSAAESGDEQKVREVSAKATALNDQRSSQARAMGLTACSST